VGGQVKGHADALLARRQVALQGGGGEIGTALHGVSGRRAGGGELGGQHAASAPTAALSRAASAESPAAATAAHPVERVGLLGGGVAGVLAHGPGAAGVHAGVGAAGEGEHAGELGVDVGAEVLDVVQAVDRLQRDALQGKGKADDLGPLHATRLGALERGPVGRSRPH
jgi:hypothetical protein